jgi:hypothetical protein
VRIKYSIEESGLLAVVHNRRPGNRDMQCEMRFCENPSKKVDSFHCLEWAETMLNQDQLSGEHQTVSNMVKIYLRRPELIRLQRLISEALGELNE